ncbi:ribonuclease D [Marinomonas agarivorans]|nr:ribonuclease D [Marinomonas agarivorans]
MKTDMNEIDIVWVETEEALAEWCKHFSQLPVIAVDTEFIRRTTYYPITGLIQISDGNSAVLIDPIAINDWKPLKTLMISESVVKVFHACSEDLEVFDRLLGVLPTPFYDTQVAESYISAQWSLSYVKLIQSYKNIEIAKDETTSDWLKRPLTEAQKRYAALDVIYLVDVYQEQVARLNEKNMLEWAKEDSQALQYQYEQNNNPELNWVNIKSAWRLSPQSLTVLRQLFIWRDETARKENIPKGQVVKDRSLWAIARFLPANHQSLMNIDEFNGRQQRLYGDYILKAIAEVKNSNKEMYEQPLPAPLPSEAGELSKAIRAFVATYCETLSIAPEAALKKKQLDPIIRYLLQGQQLEFTSPAMTGWRREALINPILEKFTQ